MQIRPLIVNSITDPIEKYMSNKAALSPTIVLNDPREIARSISTALLEDVGSGDVTAALVPAEQTAVARVICREEAVICGKQWLTKLLNNLMRVLRLAGK